MSIDSSSSHSGELDSYAARMAYDFSNLHEAIQNGEENLSHFLEVVSSDDKWLSSNTELACRAIRLIPSSEMEGDSSERFFQALENAGVFHNPTPEIASLLKDEIRNYNSSAIRMLIKHGVDTNATDEKGRTALHHVCSNEDPEVAMEIVKALLETNVKLDVSDCYGCTALNLACRSKHESVALQLVKKGANVNLSDNNHITPLHLAARYGLDTLLLKLIDKKADINALDAAFSTPLDHACSKENSTTSLYLLRHGSDFERENPFLVQLLFDSVAEGSFSNVNILLNRGMPLDNVDEEGRSLLHIAVQNEQNKIEEILRSKEIDSTMVDESGWTADDWSEAKAKSQSLRFKKMRPKFQKLLKDRFNQAIENHCYDSAEKIMALGLRGNKQIFSKALFQACLKGKKEFAKKILTNKKVDLQMEDQLGNTPLHIALENRWEDISLLMIEKGSPLNNEDTEGATPLLKACKRGLENTAMELLKKGASPKTHAYGHLTPLHMAAQHGSVKLVEELIKHEAPIDTRTSFGATPLHLAAANNSFEVVQTLLDNGSLLNIKTASGESPLYLSLVEQKPEIAIELLNRGADAKEIDVKEKTLLHHACLIDSEELFEKLLRGGADYYKKDYKNRTPLHVACSVGNQGAVEQLLKFRAKLNEQDEEGNTPFMIALMTNNKELAIRLLKEEPEINLVNKEGFSALHLALEMGLEDIAISLINMGADCNASSQSGITPLHFACDLNQNRAAINLMRKGCNVNRALPPDRLTPLHFACLQRNSELISELIKHSADVHAETIQGTAPIEELLHVPGGEKALRNLFSKYKNAVQYIDNCGKEGLLEFYSKIPEALFEENENPLLIPFLFRDPALLRSVHKKISPQNWTKAVEDLSKRFPNTNAVWCNNSLEEINERHMSKATAEDLSIPPAPEGAEVSEILELFENINFSDENTDPYRDPNFLTDDGTEASVEDLKRYLAKLVGNIKERTPFSGTPSANNPEELNNYYDEVEKLVKHIVHFCKTESEDPEENEKKVDALLNLAVAGNHCGGRYISEGRYHYASLSGSTVKNDIPTKTLKILQDLRTGILNEIKIFVTNSLGDDGAAYDVHVHQFLLKILGPRFGIPGSGSFRNYKDPYEARIHQVADENGVISSFLKKYSSHTIVQRMDTAVNDKKNREFDTSLIYDFLKDTVPSNFIPEGCKEGHYEKIKEDALKTINAPESTPEIEGMNSREQWRVITNALERQDIYLPYVEYSDSKTLSSEQRLDREIKKLKQNDYLEHCVDMSTGKISPSAIASILKNLEVFL